MSIRSKQSVFLTYSYWPALANINTWVGTITFCTELSIYQGDEKLAGRVSTQRPRPRPPYQGQVKRHKE